MHKKIEDSRVSELMEEGHGVRVYINEDSYRETGEGQRHRMITELELFEDCWTQIVDSRSILELNL